MRQLIGIIVIVIFLTACGTSAEEIAFQSEEAATDTLLPPTETATPTNTPRPTETPTPTTTPLPTSTPTPTPWQSVYPMASLGEVSDDEQDYFEDARTRLFADSTFLFDVIPQHDRDDPPMDTYPYPPFRDPYIDKMNEGLNVQMSLSDAQSLDFDAVTVDCWRCLDEGFDYWFDVWAKIPELEVCYLVERTYHRYGQVYFWLRGFTTRTPLYYGSLYSVADAGFVDEIIKQVSVTDVAPNWAYVREVLGPEMYEDLVQKLAPYALALYVERLPVCQNLAVLQEMLYEQ